MKAHIFFPIVLLFTYLLGALVLSVSKPQDPVKTFLERQACQEVHKEYLQPRWTNFSNVPLFRGQTIRTTYLCKGGLVLTVEPSASETTWLPSFYFPITETVKTTRVNP